MSAMAIALGRAQGDPSRTARTGLPPLHHDCALGTVSGSASEPAAVDRQYRRR